MEKYPPYQAIFAKLWFGESEMLEINLYDEEVETLTVSFEQQL